MKRWLQNFAYRTGMGLDIFLAAILITLIIALLTVSCQALKAALANPEQVLRH